MSCFYAITSISERFVLFCCIVFYFIVSFHTLYLRNTNPSKMLVMFCSVIFCFVVYCAVLYCGVFLPIGTKKSLKCLALCCTVLFCYVMLCPAMSFYVLHKGLSSKPSSVPTGFNSYGIKSKISFNSFNILYLFLNTCNSEYARFKSALYSSGFCIIRLIDL